MEAVQAVLGAVALAVVGIAIIMGLLILVLLETSWLIRLWARLASQFRSEGLAFERASAGEGFPKRERASAGERIPPGKRIAPREHIPSEDRTTPDERIPSGERFPPEEATSSYDHPVARKKRPNPWMEIIATGGLSLLIADPESPDIESDTASTSRVPGG